jgi:hypothetical protein
MTAHPETVTMVRKRLFARATEAFQSDPDLVASHLAAARHASGLDEPALAAWLGLPSVEALHGLALCRRPDPSSPAFVGDLQALARYTSCDAARLRQLLDQRSSPDRDRAEPLAGS